MSVGPKTPKSNDSEDGGPDSVPTEIPYSAAFEDSVRSIITNPPTQPSGLIVLSSDSTETPVPDVSILESSIDRMTLPSIPATELPLALDDPRRIYRSNVSGIRTTHPHGRLEGGPGFNATSEIEHSDAAARAWIAEHGVRNAQTLTRVLSSETNKCLDSLRRRMSDRADAVGHNARIERELVFLTDQMDMEVKVLNKARERKLRRQAEGK